jgi:hypothetical protein
MLTAGFAVIAVPWRLWRPARPGSDRSAKFIRAAYAWLGVSLAMLLLMPLHQFLSGLPFSHAYSGATRHAITVGFVSMIILGIGAKVVPSLVGVAAERLASLWGPFILINLGCFLRIALQSATDFLPHAFSVLGLSGTLEVAGIAWWGLSLVRLMYQSSSAQVGSLVRLRVDPSLRRGAGPPASEDMPCSCCGACERGRGTAPPQVSRAEPAVSLLAAPPSWESETCKPCN